MLQRGCRLVGSITNYKVDIACLARTISLALEAHLEVARIVLWQSDRSVWLRCSEMKETCRLRAKSCVMAFISTFLFRLGGGFTVEFQDIERT